MEAILQETEFWGFFLPKWNITLKLLLKVSTKTLDIPDATVYCQHMTSVLT